MKFEGIRDKQNQAKLIREILMTKMGNEMLQLEDGYGIDAEIIESINVKLFVDHNQKVLWKAGNTTFVKLFDKEVCRLVKSGVASFEEMGILTYLASEYTGHEDNYLRKDGEYLTKKKLIKDLHNETKDNPNSSESYYKKKLLDLEKKNLILSEPHPKDKRNRVLYLSPYLFYRGRFMDSKVKVALLNITKTIHNDIKKLNEEGKINIPLDNGFDKKDDNEIIDDIIEYLNLVS